MNAALQKPCRYARIPPDLGVTNRSSSTRALTILHTRTTVALLRTYSGASVKLKARESYDYYSGVLEFGVFLPKYL